MNINEEKIRLTAIEFAKRNKNQVAKKFVDVELFEPDRTPVSVFMAGSPGAGKTEYSKNLITLLEDIKKRRIIRIDPDDIRSEFPDYNGRNSYLFQGAVSLVVEKIHDLALKQKQSFIFDGTLSKFEKAVDNINRSIKLGRPIIIFYLYQKPEIAWKFTELREKVEGRNIPKEKFEEQFHNALKTVCRLREEFDDKVNIY